MSVAARSATFVSVITRGGTFHGHELRPPGMRGTTDFNDHLKGLYREILTIIFVNVYFYYFYIAWLFFKLKNEVLINR